MAKKSNHINIWDWLIGSTILGIYSFLAIFFLATLFTPEWLQKMADPGKDTEAITLKGYGDRALKAGNYDLALGNYKEALKIKPDFPSVIGNVGIIYSKIGREAEAVHVFKALAEDSPRKKSMAYERIADIYYKQEDAINAEKYYNLACEVAAFPQHSLQKVGYYAIQNGDYSKAEKNLQLAAMHISKFHSNFKSALSRDLSLYSTEDENYKQIQTLIKANDAAVLSIYDEDVFRFGLKNNKLLAQVYANLGDLSVKLGKFDESIEYYQKTIKINPQYNQARLNLNKVKAYLNNF